MIRKQKGIFIVELSLVLLVFSLLFVFSMDIILKLSHQSKLDRTSHSIASILAERRQLFNGNDLLCSTADRGCQQAVDQMYLMAKNSLARMFTDFDVKKMTMIIEQQQFKKNNQVIIMLSGYRKKRLIALLWPLKHCQSCLLKQITTGAQVYFKSLSVMKVMI